MNESRSYDNGSRLQQITHGNGLTTGFTYQADIWVTNIDVSTVEGLDFTYTYDANKNKLSEVSAGWLGSSCLLRTGK